MHLRTGLSVAVLCIAACSAGAGGTPPREFNGVQAMEYVKAQVAMGPRVPGMPGHAAEVHWLDSMLRARADSVTLQTWWHRTASGDSIQLTNVLAQFKPGATTRVLYIAHWDTRPRADNDRDSLRQHLPIPGADDGASGVAVLIGVADALHKLPPSVGVDLLFVDGEDYGSFGPPRQDVLLGASYYAQHPLAAKPLFGVLFDMIGHANLQIPIEQFSQVAAPTVVDRVWNMASSMGYSHIFVKDQSGGITDDHIPLIDAGFQVIDLIDIGNYPYWHTVDDTPDKESVQSLEAVGNVAVGVVRKAAGDAR